MHREFEVHTVALSIGGAVGGVIGGVIAHWLVHPELDLDAAAAEPAELTPNAIERRALPGRSREPAPGGPDPARIAGHRPQWRHPPHPPQQPHRHRQPARVECAVEPGPDHRVLRVLQRQCDGDRGGRVCV
ncbi:hypothetical protein [Streptomyces sp. NPDC015125]|uniref:hypothetical protein n=1 Tax=Streptomyces sp. NPDC015125 TaxID=3364938 RepID=UPI0036FF8AD3